MAWKGVITNKGNALLSQWVSGKTMTITKAAAGTGRVAEEAMLAQTSLVNEKQMASILSNEPAEAGQRLKLQVTPQAAAYSLNQFGVWAELEGEENMIALFQTDTETGVEIPSLADVPDFVYTFYGMLGFSGTGNLQVIVDPEALASMENVGAAVAAHNTNKEAHADLREAIRTGLDGKAPTNHAAVDTTHGAGSGSNYGHVKLSDATNSTSGAGGGTAATPAAVKAAYDLANGKAAANHGNHVPAAETANNARFLRNDNTWQAVTPSNIGASATGHKHTKSEITDFPTSMTPTAHNQAASTITAGTFAGQVVANGSGQTPGTSLLRNSKLVSADTNPTVNGEICWTYE